MENSQEFQKIKKIYINQQPARYYSTGDYYQMAAHRMGHLCHFGKDEYDSKINYDYIFHFSVDDLSPQIKGKHIYFERDSHNSLIFQHVHNKSEDCVSCQVCADHRFYDQYSKNGSWLDEEVIPHAADLHIHKRIKDPSYDVVFVGRSYEGLGELARIDWLREIKKEGIDIKIYGDGFTPEQYNALLNEGVIILNKSYDEEINRRIFEGMAIGTLLTDDVPFLNKVGKEAVHFFTYPSDCTPIQVSGIIKKLLEDKQQLYNVAKNARKLIETRHTYDHRLNDVLKLVSYEK